MDVLPLVHILKSVADHSFIFVLAFVCCCGGGGSSVGAQRPANYAKGRHQLAKPGLRY